MHTHLILLKMSLRLIIIDKILDGKSAANHIVSRFLLGVARLKSGASKHT